MKYEYRKVKGYDYKKFIENGHTMFENDVLKRLERLAYLESAFKKINEEKVRQVQNAVIEPKKGMEELKIYKYNAETIADALRIAANVLDSRKKITCLDRDIMQSIGIIKNVISGEFKEFVKR